MYLLCRLFGAAAKHVPTAQATAAMIKATKQHRHPGVLAEVRTKHKWRSAMSERTGRPVYYHTDGSTLTLQFNVPSALSGSGLGSADTYSVRVDHRGSPQHVDLPPTRVELQTDPRDTEPKTEDPRDTEPKTERDHSDSEPKTRVAGHLGEEALDSESPSPRAAKSDRKVRDGRKLGKRKQQQPHLFFGKKSEPQWACPRCTYLNQRSVCPLACRHSPPPRLLRKLTLTCVCRSVTRCKMCKARRADDSTGRRRSKRVRTTKP